MLYAIIAATLGLSKNQSLSLKAFPPEFFPPGFFHSRVITFIIPIHLFCGLVWIFLS